MKVDKAKLTRKLKRRTVSDLKRCEHNIFTHFPKCPDCDICQRNKPRRASCKAKSTPQGDGLPLAKEFGDRITSDHKVLNEEDESRQADRNAHIIQDFATYWLQAYAAKHKDAKETK